MNKSQGLGIHDCIHDKVAWKVYKKTKDFPLGFHMLTQSVKLNPEHNYYIQLSNKQTMQFQKNIYYTI